jgi:hypothetical protein
MAKQKKPAKKIGGPFLAAAFFCEGISEDMDTALSVIRIVDTINLVISSQAPSDMPSKSNPVVLTPAILISFRSGDSPGKHKLTLVMQTPAGQRTEMFSQEVEFTKQPQGGTNLKTRTTMKVFGNGVYLIDVILDGKRYTRMPLNVSIQRADAVDSATPMPDKMGTRPSRLPPK